MNIYIRQPIC